jgi:hypothetical protein
MEGIDYSNPKICHGKGSGGGGTNTVTSTASPPPQVLQAYQTALNSAQTAASQPLQQYNGATVAGFTPDQLSAFGTIDSSQNVAQPFINQAQIALTAGQTPLWNGVQQFSPSAVQAYQSPYTSSVLNTTMAAEQNQDAQQQAALQGNAISSGAWGGDRAGVASAVLSGQQDVANNATNANIENTGYNTGLSEFNTQQQSQLGANEANAYLNEQAGFGLAGLGTEAQNTTLQGANAQLQSGAIQQQLGQEALNVPYEQFQAQQAYPFQTAQYFANVAEGLGGGSGGTSSTTSPAASTASQIGGLGLGGLSLAGGALSGGLARGGHVSQRRGAFGAGGLVRRGFASGGDIASGVPDVSLSVIPNTSSTPGGHGNGIPAPPKAVTSPSTSPSPASLAAAGKGGAQLYNWLSGLGGSGNDLEGLDPAAASVWNTGIGEGMSFGDITPLAAQASEDANFMGGLGTLGDAGAGADLGGMSFADAAASGATLSGDAAFTGAADAGGSALLDALPFALFRRGGSAGGFGTRRHYDDGGQVGGQTPMAAQSAITSPVAQTYNTSYQNLTPQQLQQIMMRLPPGSQQQRAAQQVLQQKRTMPNVGVQAQGGFGTQSQTQQQPMYGGFARGGPARFADGGDTDDAPESIRLDGTIPPPPDASTLSRAADLGDLPGAGTVTPVSDSDLMPPGSSGAAPATGGFGTRRASSPPDNNEETPPNTRVPAKADPWLALAAAGFGMAAGNSPNALQNVGAGALEGIKNYQGQQQHADSVNEAADKLMQEAKQHKDALGIEQENADTNAQYRKDQAAYQQAALKQKEIVKDAFGQPIGVFNPATNSMEPIKGLPQQMPVAGAPQQTTINGSISAPPQSAQANAPPDLQDGLSRYPAQYQPLILGVIQGRIPPDRMHLGMDPKPIVAAAASIDPSFDETNPAQRMRTVSDYSPAGKSGQAISQLDYASKHAAQMALAAMDLNNTNGIPLVNTMWNSAVNSAENSSGDPRVTNFKNTLNSYAPEVTKFISGKSNFAEKELEDIQNAIPQNGSLAQQLGAISQKNGMMATRAQTMQDQYDKAAGPYGQKREVIRPETQAAMQDMDTLYRGARDGKMDSPDVKAAVGRLQNYASGAAAPPPDQRQAGKTYPTPKGLMQWTGTGWLPPGGSQ